MESGQERAPIFEALLEYAGRGITPLHTPGHKGRDAAGGDEGLLRLLTRAGLACDLPSLDATDSPRHPTGCVAEAEQLAAELCGAGGTMLLTGGATQGVQAMMLAALRPGDEVLIARNLHLATFSGLVLTGAVPRYLPSAAHEACGLLPPSPAIIAEALDAWPRAAAVLLTQPSYFGVGRPLRSIAQACHARGVPLLVDEAHGAHLTFLPPAHLRPALEEGADLVVQSAHKTLDSLVGTAWLHRGRGSLIDEERLRAALNLIQSTSPSYLLLASLDLARRGLFRSGAQRFAAATGRALALRDRLRSIDGVKPLLPGDTDGLEELLGDPLRLVVDVSGLGLDGFTAERRLREEHRLYGELADARNVGYVLGPSDEEDAAGRLAGAFEILSKEARAGGVLRANLTPSSAIPWAPPEVELTPREAAGRRSRPCSPSLAKGALAAETITAYPPGIPLVCPGERITAAILDELQRLRALGATLFATDPALETIRVLAE